MQNPFTNHYREIHQIFGTEICQTGRKALQTGLGYSTHRSHTCSLLFLSKALSSQVRCTWQSLWRPLLNSYRKGLAYERQGIEKKRGYGLQYNRYKPKMSKDIQINTTIHHNTGISHRQDLHGHYSALHF